MMYAWTFQSTYVEQLTCGIACLKMWSTAAFSGRIRSLCLNILLNLEVFKTFLFYVYFIAVLRTLEL